MLAGGMKQRPAKQGQTVVKVVQNFVFLLGPNYCFAFLTRLKEKPVTAQLTLRNGNRQTNPLLDLRPMPTVNPGRHHLDIFQVIGGVDPNARDTCWFTGISVHFGSRNDINFLLML